MIRGEPHPVQRGTIRWRDAIAADSLSGRLEQGGTMVSSAATTVEGYLASLPPERRAIVSAVRDLVRESMPTGYRESMAWGMIGYCIPLERYPDTYNGQPLAYVALAAQKSHYALYLTCAEGDQGDAQRLKDAFERAGKRLDMGKSCLRFRSLDDLPLRAIGEIIASVPPDELIARYERSRAAPRPARPNKSGAKQTSAKNTSARKSSAKKSATRKRR
jgi:hypothetical protein